MRRKHRTARRSISSIPSQSPRLRSARARNVTASEPVALIDLGRRSYRETLALQRQLHGRVARGEAPDTWIVVEHDPVITLGRTAKRENVLLSPETLAARGVDVVEVERGGDATYHGPGQVVIYPILKLARFREVVPLVSALERSAIAALHTFGIEARARDEHRGVYVGDEAICAIGLAVKQMTSMHGLALNVATALDYDRLITPCGTPQFGITSISKLLGRVVPWAEGRDALLDALGREFGVALRFHAALRSQAALRFDAADPFDESRPGDLPLERERA